MLYDADFKLVAEAQTAFVQEVYTRTSPTPILHHQEVYTLQGYLAQKKCPHP